MRDTGKAIITMIGLGICLILLLLPGVLADNGPGYYYYSHDRNDIHLEAITLLGIFSGTMIINGIVIKFLNRNRRREGYIYVLDGYVSLTELFVYTLVLFFLELIIFVATFIAYSNTYPFVVSNFSVSLISSFISIPAIMVAYFFLIDKNWSNAFKMSILTNPMWLYLILVLVNGA